MSAVGMVLVGAVLFNLATEDVPVPVAAENTDIVLETVTRNLLQAALPQSATDVIAVSLGETIGAVVGVFATTIVTSLVSLRMRILGMEWSAMMPSDSQKPFWTQALANTDYFLVRAAVTPILISAGLDPLPAAVGSVFIATVPYELVKYQARIQSFRRTEDELLAELLREEEARRKNGRFSRSNNARDDAAVLQPVSPSPLTLDIPEFVADLIQWLEYDVLKSEYSGTLIMMGIPVTNAGAESAVFGFLAALSSQLYLDVLYQTTNLGPAQESERARNRSLLDILTAYTTRCLQTAALFGVYESVKQPIRQSLATVLSGGVAGCLGSGNYDACVDEYLLNNPFESISFQDQIRGLAAAVGALIERLQTEGLDLFPALLDPAHAYSTFYLF